LFQGSIVALVTPFKDGKLDEGALRSLLRLHLASGTSAVVPVGTTGESPTLSQDEAKRVIEISIEECKGKIPVIAGTGSNATAKSVEMTQWAKKAGADAALIVCPYYNKPTQEGVYEHYKAVAEDGGLPIVVYTIPGRSVINITSQTVVRLAELKNIVALKEASGSFSQIAEIISLVGDRISVLSGDDPLTLPMMALGAKGVISVAANLDPKRMAALCAQVLAGRMAEARKLHEELLPLFQTMFVETNPIGIKAAMELAGHCSGDLRLPMTPMEAGNRKKLEAAMKTLGLIR
jgi:4-hydroxy-tetrahydrodipicolinate synthase